jgi:hypothetical protein
MVGAKVINATLESTISNARLIAHSLRSMDRDAGRQPTSSRSLFSACAAAPRCCDRVPGESDRNDPQNGHDRVDQAALVPRYRQQISSTLPDCAVRMASLNMSRSRSDMPLRSRNRMQESGKLSIGL